MSNDVTSDPKTTPYQKWSAEIEAAEKELDKFHKRANKVNKRYIDERDSNDVVSKWFNIFHSNVNIMGAALYAQLPKPDVSRKFKDYEDDTARVAALIIQRAITADLDDPRDTFDATMRQCVQDRLVPGLAMAWLRLETDTSPVEDVVLEGAEETDEAAPMQITDQRVCVDYVYWEDFLWSPCRVWDERRWVGRKVYMDREELVERWPDKGKLIPLNFKKDRNPDGTVPKNEIHSKAVIYEIWDRTARKVTWFSKGMEEVIEQIDDPLGLVGFEPCPRPMLTNITTSNTVPRPDFYMLQDQYNELDTINNRISMLVQACKVVGVYDKAAAGVARMLQEGSDNTLIPVDNWAMFAEKGGLKGQVDWLPLDTVVQSLQHLNAAREVIKAQIYELTGISDIIRGASKASETLGAQQIKAQFAGIRIKKLQYEVARFAGEILRIKAELQIKHFSPEMLIKKSNIMATGNDQYIEPAMQLLQDATEFEWRITVSTDTIAQADYEQEKQAKTEFMTAVSGYLEKVAPLAAQVPEMAPALLGLLKWGIAGYSNATEIEGMLDQALDSMTKQLQQPKPPPGPTPEEQKMQAEMQKMQQQAQRDAQAAQQEMQLKQIEAQMEQQARQQELQAEQMRLSMEMQAEQQRLALERQSQEMQLMFQQAMQQLKLQGQVEMQDAKLEAARAQAAAKPTETNNGS